MLYPLTRAPGVAEFVMARSAGSPDLSTVFISSGASSGERYSDRALAATKEFLRDFFPPATGMRRGPAPTAFRHSVSNSAITRRPFAVTCSGFFASDVRLNGRSIQCFSSATSMMRLTFDELTPVVSQTCFCQVFGVLAQWANTFNTSAICQPA